MAVGTFGAWLGLAGRSSSNLTSPGQRPGNGDRSIRSLGPTARQFAEFGSIGEQIAGPLALAVPGRDVFPGRWPGQGKSPGLRPGTCIGCEHVTVVIYTPSPAGIADGSRRSPRRGVPPEHDAHTRAAAPEGSADRCEPPFGDGVRFRESVTGGIRYAQTTGYLLGPLRGPLATERYSGQGPSAVISAPVLGQRVAPGFRLICSTDGIACHRSHLGQ